MAHLMGSVLHRGEALVGTAAALLKIYSESLPESS
jgi:hypothetical protein